MDEEQRSSLIHPCRGSYALLKGVLDMEKKKGYPYIIGCKNCGYRLGPVMIPMGVTVDEFCTGCDDKCPRCGVCDWGGVERL